VRYAICRGGAAIETGFREGVMLEPVVARIRRWNVKTLKPFGSMSNETLRLSLGDVNASVTEAMVQAFTGIASVEVVCGDLLNLSCDAIVSPANSFGNMGGGIDKAIDDFHQGAAQAAVTRAIADQFYGELPVGSAVVVELPSSRWPFIVAAPTMRVPGSIQKTINAYLAMRAALVAVLRHSRHAERPIRSLAIPGLGTGVGGLDPADAAAQMRAAYDSVVGGKWKGVVTGAQAPFARRGN
jgi:O-acetyl-ADP-ribose deacetylase (regulator of RNase III)